MILPKKQNSTNLIVRAEIVEADNFTAIAIPDEKLNDPEIINAWVFIEEKSYGNMKTNVFVTEKIENRKKIIEKMKKSPVIKIVKKNNIQIADIIISDSTIKQEYFLNYTIKNDNKSYLSKISNKNTDKIALEIHKEILFYSKAKYLKQLQLINLDIDVKLELLPVKNYEEKDGGYVATEYGKQKDKTINGQTEYKNGELFIFKVINKGYKEAYFQIMDIQPNNEVSILIPGKGMNEGDFKIEGGQTIIFTSKIMQIGKPFGTDMFKIIVSPKPMYNLRNIIENKKSTRGSKTPFEILSQNISTGTRGNKPISVPVNTVNTHSVIIKTYDK